jgi:hypothetical protein
VSGKIDAVSGVGMVGRKVVRHQRTPRLLVLATALGTRNTYLFVIPAKEAANDDYSNKNSLKKLLET